VKAQIGKLAGKHYLELVATIDPVEVENVAMAVVAHNNKTKANQSNQNSQR
jgi:hypothetical protein